MKKIILNSLTTIFFLLLLLSIFLLLSSKKIKKVNVEKDSQKDINIVQEIIKVNQNDEIDEKFLNWIKINYGDNTLKKIHQEIKNNHYKEQLWHDITSNSLKVLKDKYNNIQLNKKEVKTENNQVTLSFIGDVSLADNWYIMPKYEERNKKIYGILSEEIVNELKMSNITVANNEFTISNRGEKMPGKYYTFRASPNRLSIYQEMGVDLVTLANNHVYDFGKLAFQDTLESLKQYNIPYIGAGNNLEEAMQPYYFIANGYKIAFLNATRAEKIILTPEATADEGGVFRCYDPSHLINMIKKTKSQSDFVITLVHWGKEDSSKLEPVQVDTAKQYIDAGSDLIVGTHAHTLQGIDFYNQKAIIYNLGDFIFNNETKDTEIFQLTINDAGQFQYKIIPCQQKDEYTSILNNQEKERVINKIRNLSPNVSITEEGNFFSKNAE